MFLKPKNLQIKYNSYCILGQVLKSNIDKRLQLLHIFIVKVKSIYVCSNSKYLLTLLWGIGDIIKLVEKNQYKHLVHSFEISRYAFPFQCVTLTEFLYFYGWGEDTTASVRDVCEGRAPVRRAVEDDPWRVTYNVWTIRP